MPAPSSSSVANDVSDWLRFEGFETVHTVWAPDVTDDDRTLPYPFGWTMSTAAANGTPVGVAISHRALAMGALQSALSLHDQEDPFSFHSLLGSIEHFAGEWRAAVNWHFRDSRPPPDEPFVDDDGRYWFGVFETPQPTSPPPPLAERRYFVPQHLHDLGVRGGQITVDQFSRRSD